MKLGTSIVRLVLSVLLISDFFGTTSASATFLSFFERFGSDRCRENLKSTPKNALLKTSGWRDFEAVTTETVTEHEKETSSSAWLHLGEPKSQKMIRFENSKPIGYTAEFVTIKYPYRLKGREISGVYAHSDGTVQKFSGKVSKVESHGHNFTTAHIVLPDGSVFELSLPDNPNLKALAVAKSLPTEFISTGPFKGMSLEKQLAQDRKDFERTLQDSNQVVYDFLKEEHVSGRNWQAVAPFQRDTPGTGVLRRIDTTGIDPKTLVGRKIIGVQVKEYDDSVEIFAGTVTTAYRKYPHRGSDVEDLYVELETNADSQWTGTIGAVGEEVTRLFVESP